MRIVVEVTALDDENESVNPTDLANDVACWIEHSYVDLKADPVTAQTYSFTGTLEIDPSRGVIYFHDESTGMTLLRICSLPRPIPSPAEGLDITWNVGVNWRDK
ncbi:MAG: hypothetical protein ACRDSF_00245 [Pseudonocardiaceae bacterium]